MGAATSVPAPFNTWRTLEVEGHAAGTAFKRTAREAGILINDAADMWIEHVPFHPGLIQAELVNLSVHDLGFERNTPFWNVRNRVDELGFSVDAETQIALELRIAYVDQPDGEQINCLTRPVVGSGMFPLSMIFKLSEGDGERYLSMESYRDDRYCLPDERLILIRR